MSELTVVGKPVTRVDASEKVTGQIVYGYDLVLPNMLYGKTLFSNKAHAKIKKINTEKAKQLPGVVAVVTGEDAPWTHGESIKDKPFLAQGKVRYIGEPVAAVAAEDEDTAQDSDLSGCEADAVGIAHQHLHALDEPSQVVVEL